MQGKDIIELILSDLGIKAPTFANSIGLKYQRILDIQSGKTKKISSTVADAIIEKYPQYSKVWLLTGEGSRTHEDKSANILGNNSGINNSGTINMSHSTIDNRSYYSDSPDVSRARRRGSRARRRESRARRRESTSCSISLPGNNNH